MAAGKQFVGCRIIVGVHRLRCHQPLVLVNRLAGLGHHFGMSPQVGTFDVCPIRIILDFQCTIIFPFVRIANLYVEGRELLQSLHLGRVAHPFEGLDTFAQGRLQVLHKAYHTFFGGGREVFLYIHLPYGFAQHGAYHAYGRLPAGLHFLCTRHRTAIEIEILLLHGVVQVAGGGVNQLPLQIEFLLVEGQRINNLDRCLERSGLADDDFVHIVQIESLQVGIPVESGVLLLDVGHRHLVVVGMRVT